FFNVSSKEELIMLEKSSVSPINKAARVMLDYSRDGVLREIARLREKALHDEASAMESAMSEGIQKGMEMGMQVGREEGMQVGREEGMEIGMQKGMQVGREEGREEGMEMGMQKGRLEERKLMLEQAAKIFAEMGLSQEEIAEKLERM
ncbi:MAG: hypothetical protein ACOX8U_12000, partial [Bradymonadia bacterium]